MKIKSEGIIPIAIALLVTITIVTLSAAISTNNFKKEYMEPMKPINNAVDKVMKDVFTLNVDNLGESVDGALNEIMYFNVDIKPGEKNHNYIRARNKISIDLIKLKDELIKIKQTLNSNEKDVQAGIDNARDIYEKIFKDEIKAQD